MKQESTLNFLCGKYKSFVGLLFLPLIFFSLLFPGLTQAQCSAGYSQVVLDWDNLDYFAYTGNYTSGYLSSNTVAQNQNFTFGTQRVTITNNYAAGNNLGENALHTGDAGSYGIGSQDINFNGNGTVTYVFENEVQNFKLSIFDLDNGQVATVTALNAASVALPVILTKVVPLSPSISVNLVPVTAPSATATVAAIASNVNTNTINVDIAGPVKSITVTISGTAGDYWLSNVTACSAGTFPTGYYNVSKPFTNQPGFVLHAFDDDVYAVNPATGVTKYLFTDNTNPYGGSGYINSMGYDPYNRFLYYVYSLTSSPGTNVMMKKYDFNTGTISTILSDITTIGVPIVTGGGSPVRGSGVESGGGAFYNGSFYIGIETNNKNASGTIQSSSGREAVIWRIDFNGSNVPYRSSQLFGTPEDDGAGTLLHDWSDFVINDGILYDFDGAGVTTQTDVSQVDMISSATTNYHIPTGFTPGQPSVDYNGNLYNLYATSIAPAVTPYVAPYNPSTGTIGTKINITSTPAYTPAIPSLGDAAEAFRPLGDFGDAPSSYDPSSGDPAVHDTIASLRLGAAESVEWLTRGQSVLANSDNNEDAIGSAPNLNFNGTLTYTVSNINVYNNTGGNATLIAWLDYNLNGVFDAGEGRLATVPTSASIQSITLTWSSIFVPNTAALRTYLRIRLTKASNSMTTANPTGYMPDGEVEDYPVVMGINLPLNITAFDVKKGSGKTAVLSLTTTGTVQDVKALEVERSLDGQQWSVIGPIDVTKQANADKFDYTDINPLPGKSYYRIKTNMRDGSTKFTEARSITFGFLKGTVTFAPNPVTEYVNIQLSADRSTTASIALFDYSGRTVYTKNIALNAGDNTVRIADLGNITSGVYYIKLTSGADTFTDKLIIKRN